MVAKQIGSHLCSADSSLFHLICPIRTAFTRKGMSTDRRKACISVQVAFMSLRYQLRFVTGAQRTRSLLVERMDQEDVAWFANMLLASSDIPPL